MAFEFSAFPFSVQVLGLPQPQGSKRIGRHGKHAVILDSNDATLRPWRATVTAVVAAKRASSAGYSAPYDCPLSLFLCFTLPRPKSAPKSRRYPSKVPDLDKLIRAVGDGITDAGLWLDDSLVVSLTATKRYVGDALAMPSPGVEIGVAPLCPSRP